MESLPTPHPSPTPPQPPDLLIVKQREQQLQRLLNGRGVCAAITAPLLVNRKPDGDNSSSLAELRYVNPLFIYLLRGLSRPNSERSGTYFDGDDVARFPESYFEDLPTGAAADLALADQVRHLGRVPLDRRGRTDTH